VSRVVLEPKSIDEGAVFRQGVGDHVGRTDCSR
jgi:hypothetical protein